jgi:hypothetical protein
MRGTADGPIEGIDLETSRILGKETHLRKKIKENIL